LQQTIKLVYEDLQQGKTLAQAVEARRNSFPPLYAKLIDAGVRSGNLSGILLGLGQHMALFRRLQAAIWRAATYPLIVLVCFVGLISFAIFRIVPQFEVFFTDFHSELPGITRLLIAFSQIACSPPFLTCLAIFLALLTFFCLYLRFSVHGASLAASLMLPMPLIGPVIQRSLVARWCDAVSLGVEAGLDLPSAIDLAAESIDSRALTADGKALVAALSAGQPLTAAPPGQILPGTVPAAIEMASSRNDLPLTLRTLSQMYRQRAETRLATVPGILTPFLLIMMGALTAVLAFAMLAPIITLIESISGSPHHK
jgi:type II secretory pathway component PulF